jgi:3-hydroxybutyryl-CoA dehydrogenase
MEEKHKIGVLGAGMMGAEIALCFAHSGFETIMKEISIEMAEKGKSRVAVSLDKAIQKGRFQAKDKDSTLARIIPTDNYSLFENVDLVIEAVSEDLEVKRMVFVELDGICKPECVFASNTSSIPITQLATFVTRDRIGRFIGAHFFSPASIMKLVEVIPGLETQEESVAFMMACCKMIGKTPIRVKDVAGFAVNRIIHAMVIEALRLVEEGVASPEDIDTACKLGLGHPVGPFALMDLSNNALVLRIQEILHDAYGERFRPHPILKQKVHAKHLGRITGKGWYSY